MQTSNSTWKKPDHPYTRKILFVLTFACLLAAPANRLIQPLQGQADGRTRADHLLGKRLFERETFGGNGRTCVTCHSRETGTVSPVDAEHRFAADPNDPLFRGDGSDDGQGNGVARMLNDATIRMTIPLPEHVSLAHDPSARTVVLHRGIPSTLNTPALDPILMVDGRHRDLALQALEAITDHAQPTRVPSSAEVEALVEFERQLFSSRALRKFAGTGRIALPQGWTEAEKRGRTFFEDVPAGAGNSKRGICAFCHSGPMLNETNEFIPAPPFGRGGRFQSVLVSDFNVAGNPVYDFVFRNEDGTTTTISSPDPGRALITGIAGDPDISGDPHGEESINAFKIPSLWGVPRTAPYFHDNSAKTLEDVARHYARFMAIVTDPSIDGDPPIELTEEDQRDIVAFLKLLR
jgi:cytochrome c peroxidase